MANRKLGPVQGDLCWFCKMPSDDESWMGLGILKSSREPVFDGHYILYHECCAVYSCGAEDTPPSGMSDESLVKFYRHGEKAAGIGLKCTLCGKRGATTGCFYGPCQQFYHFPCARARAYQGYLRFSLDGKRLACMEHAPLLPLPHEVDFMGMWMEGVGSWNGMLMEQATEQWHPAYQAYHAQFLQRWSPLLSMTPAADIKALQEMAKGSRRNIKGSKSTSKSKEDPDYRAKAGGPSKPRRSTAAGQGRQQQQHDPSWAGSSGGAAAAAAAGRPSSSSGGRRKSQQQRGSRRPTGQPMAWAGGVGVPADVAAAAERGDHRGSYGGGYGGAAAAAAGGGGGYPSTSHSSMMMEGAGGSGELFSPTSDFSRQQQQQQYQGPAGWALGGQPQQQPQQWAQHSGDAAGMGAASAGGYGVDAAHARDVGVGMQQQQQQQHSAGPGTHSNGDSLQALKELLAHAQGPNLHDQPGSLADRAPGTAAAGAAGIKPELSCQLLLAAAGFEPDMHVITDWPGQRASSAGRVANQVQDWGAAAAAYIEEQQRKHQGSAHHHAAAGTAAPPPQASIGGHHGLAGVVTAPPAAAAGARGGMGLGRSASGGSSADSAPNGANQPDTEQRLSPAAGQAGQFRYTSGVCVGPGGPEQPGKQHKLLDLNVLARTGRRQLSNGVLGLDGQQQQQQQPPVAAPQAHQQQPQPAAAAAAAPSSSTQADMLQQIAAAMKAVTEAEGEAQAQALAAAAAMVAAAAAAAGGSSGAPAAGSAEQPQPMPVAQATGQPAAPEPQPQLDNSFLTRPVGVQQQLQQQQQQPAVLIPALQQQQQQQEVPATQQQVVVPAQQQPQQQQQPDHAVQLQGVEQEIWDLLRQQFGPE